MNGQKILMTLMGMEIGGAETHVLELCKALTHKGMRVYVASNGGAYEPELKACGIVHYKVPMHNKRLDNIVNAYFALKKIIRDNDIQLVHAHARIPGFLCGLLQKKLGFRYVTTAHWVFTTEFPFNVLSNWGEKSLAVSGDIRRYLIDNYGVPEENIYVTVNGFDTQKFAPGTDFTPLRERFGLTDGQIRIVSLSRLDKDRSMPAHQLIEAAPVLVQAYPQVKICIVGDGDDYARVAREADAMNRRLERDIIIMAGASTEADQWMAAADIFVNSSRALLEAMSAGRPVVASGNEGYLGLLTEENLPIAVETNFTFRGCAESTVQKLTGDLLTLLALSPEERAKAGAFGREVVLQHYSMERMAEDAMAVYRDVLASPWPERLKTPVRGWSNAARSARPCSRGVVISGYYGYNNSGDDILLRSIVDNLRAGRGDMPVTVLSMRPKETRAQYGVDAVYRFNFLSVYRRLRRARLLITGGGNLIQDETSTQSLIYYLWVINTARRLGVKNMLYANGIGPINKPVNIERARRALQRVDLITLRDRESLQTLRDMRVTAPETHVTADAVFALPPVSEKEARACLANLAVTGPYFCVAIRSWMHNPPGLERQVALFADKIAKQYAYTPVFIAMRPSEDTDITRRVMEQMRTPSVLMNPSIGDINAIRGVTGLSQFVLSMRLHTLVYAVEKAVPVIGLVYGPKIRQFMDSVGQHYYMPVEQTDADVLARFADEIVADRDRVSAEIEKAGRAERERAAQNAVLCAALLER